MSLPVREWRALRGIDAALCRSDPGLASMMTIFARLASAEPMPDHESGPALFVRACAFALMVLTSMIRVLGQVLRACLRALTSPDPQVALDRARGRWASPMNRAHWYWHQ